eukprot:4016477-Lingulodinium_polyedra.AAC.1
MTVAGGVWCPLPKEVANEHATCDCHTSRCPTCRGTRRILRPRGPMQQGEEVTVPVGFGGR